MTSSMKWLVYFLSGFFVLGFFHCNDQVSGATETGNTGPIALTGRLVTPSGKPARNVAVRIRPAGALADTTGRLAKATADTASIRTDSNGVYAVDTGLLDPGTFVIEGSDGAGNLALIRDVEVLDPAITVHVPQDTLKPAGVIKGVIRLSEGGDLTKVLVLAFGIDRFVLVKADGSFKFSRLAESEYDLRILFTLGSYGVLDLTGVAVASADTLDLGILDLPFEGIPVPKGVALVYDTLGQTVTVRWEAADPALVLGYNLYRKHSDSDYIKINKALIFDTAFADSTLRTTAAYQYKVAAVDAAETEGVKSAAAAVSFRNRLERVSSVTPLGMRREHSSLYFKDRLWIIAGSDGNALKGDVWSSPDGITWTKTVELADFGPRRQHASHIFDGKMWVIGGRSGTRELNDVWFSEDGISWALAADSANFPPRMGHAFVSFGNKMWVIGGIGDELLSDVWFSTDGASWIQETDSAPFGPRMRHAVTSFLGNLLLFGGESGNGHMNDIWTSSDCITWTVATSSTPFAGRSAFSSSVLDGTLWIFGGMGHPGPLSDIWFTHNGIDWQLFNTPPDFGPISHHTSVAGEGRTWTIGGSATDSEVWSLR